MRTLIYFGIASLSLTLVSCEKENENAISECLQEKLLTFDTNEACNTGASLTEYTYLNKTVFKFDPGYCGADMTSEVVDENCATLGYLGGITGNDTITGDNFTLNAVVSRQIWAN